MVVVVVPVSLVMPVSVGAGGRLAASWYGSGPSTVCSIVVVVVVVVVCSAGRSAAVLVDVSCAPPSPEGADIAVGGSEAVCMPPDEIDAEGCVILPVKEDGTTAPPGSVKLP
ncbi:hypothetical protein GCM10010520_61870 [Rhizobium viscosum]